MYCTRFIERSSVNTNTMFGRLTASTGGGTVVVVVDVAGTVEAVFDDPEHAPSTPPTRPRDTSSTTGRRRPVDRRIVDLRMRSAFSTAETVIRQIPTAVAADYESRYDERPCSAPRIAANAGLVTPFTRNIPMLSSTADALPEASRTVNTISGPVNVHALH